MKAGECTEACGFCYGDEGSNADKSLPTDSALFFRMISDFYALDGVLDERCPELEKR